MALTESMEGGLLVNKAKARANKKYNAKAYDLLSVRVPKGEKEIFREFAAQCGESLAKFVRTACLGRIDAK